MYAATRGDDCQSHGITLQYIDATLEGDEICQELLEILFHHHHDVQPPLPSQHANTNSNTIDTTTSSSSGTSETTSSNAGTRTSFLKEFGIDMTQLARDGEYDRIHGRHSEIESLLAHSITKT
jgi:ATP-dependent Clp protease ATP-binding subunit ClpA